MADIKSIIKKVGGKNGRIDSLAERRAFLLALGATPAKKDKHGVTRLSEAKAKAAFGANYKNLEFKNFRGGITTGDLQYMAGPSFDYAQLQAKLAGKTAAKSKPAKPASKAPAISETKPASTQPANKPASTEKPAMPPVEPPPAEETKPTMAKPPIQVQLPKDGDTKPAATQAPALIPASALKDGKLDQAGLTSYLLGKGLTQAKLDQLAKEASGDKTADAAMEVENQKTVEAIFSAIGVPWTNLLMAYLEANKIRGADSYATFANYILQSAGAQKDAAGQYVVTAEQLAAAAKKSAALQAASKTAPTAKA